MGVHFPNSGNGLRGWAVLTVDWRHLGPHVLGVGHVYLLRISDQIFSNTIRKIKLRSCSDDIPWMFYDF